MVSFWCPFNATPTRAKTGSPRMEEPANWRASALSWARASVRYKAAPKSRPQRHAALILVNGRGSPTKRSQRKELPLTMMVLFHVNLGIFQTSTSGCNFHIKAHRWLRLFSRDTQNVSLILGTPKIGRKAISNMASIASLWFHGQVDFARRSFSYNRGPLRGFPNKQVSKTQKVDLDLEHQGPRVLGCV